jgi:hypothetical protein
VTEAEHIIEECEARGVVLGVGESSSALDYDAPAGAMTPELLSLLAAHKAEVIQVLVEREERAALSGCPDNVSASQWARVMNHPAVIKLQSVGLFHSIFEVRPLKQRREEAA